MAIRGDLLSIDLSNVFQMLAMNRKQGVLRLQNRENILEKRALVLDADRIGLLEMPKNQDLAAILVDQGELSYDDYTDALTKSGQFQVPAVEFLEKRGTITREQVEGATRRLHEELILEIFLWKNVSFNLDEESWPEENPNRQFFVLDLTVMEAARRQDEWARVIDQIGGGKHIWAQTTSESGSIGLEFSAVERIVFNHIDNVCGSPEITNATGLPRYHVDLALSNLKERGNVRKLELDDLIEVGDQLVIDGRHEDGIRLFKCAVRYDRRSIALHKRLAQAYLRENRIAKAASHYKFCAIALVEKGLVREALAIYQYLMGILPTDFRALEQGLCLLSQLEDVLNNEDHETFDLGLKLCSFYFESARYSDAQRILDYLLTIAPDDIGLSFLQARVLAKNGQINEAIETYMRLAARMHAMGDLAGALGAYKLVVSFDSVTKDICLEKIQEIERQLDQQKRQKMAGLAFFVTVVMIVTTIIAYLYYHNTAEAAYDQIHEAETNIVTQEGWQAQAQRYAGIADRFPLTMTASNAKDDETRALGEVHNLRRKFQLSKVELREEEKKSRKRADDHVSRAKSHLILGDLKNSLAAYEKAWAELRSSSQQSWGAHESRQIPGRMKEIEEHLTRETKALKEIEQHLANGEFETAHQKARKNFFAESRDQLSIESIRVVSRQTLAQLRVPFEIIAAPVDALISDRENLDSRGVKRLQLTAESPNAKYEISRPGFRAKERRLSWEESPFQSIVVLEKLPAERREIGDRISDVALDGRAVVFLAGNGVVYRAETLGAKPRRVESESFVSPCTGLVIANGGAVFATTEGHVMFFDAEKKDPKNWDTRVSLDPIAGLVVHGTTYVVATHDGNPRIIFLDNKGNEFPNPIKLKSPILHLVEDSGRVFAVDEAGSLLEIDVSKRKIEKTVLGTYNGEPVIHGQSIFVTDILGRLHRLTRDLQSSVKFDLERRIKGNLVRSGTRLLGVLKDGGILEIGSNDQTRVLGKKWKALLRESTGVIYPLDRSEFLVELEDGSQVLLNAEQDKLLHGLRSQSGSRSISFRYDGRCVLVAGDVHGAIETYRD
ncbi:MAG: tetratricopeptide (TPR) repeat protein [Planctomycetota bacterium]|jgi:tetratricopeptide (TPR) repeat protein